ncbi:MAG: glycosyltransferase family 2 protein [Bacilli bacterium]|nr:glycosyltransferase family 2 protein [Bacilli bacterium]
MKKLSVVVPCYNEEEMLPLFYKEVNKILKDMKIVYELIFVNDGSKDKTIDVMKKLYKEDNNIKIVNFSRNFGKEAALFAGLEAATGSYVAVMDADLQDPPILLPEMIKILDEKEYDSVATYRVNRKGEPPIRSFFAKLYYKIMNKISTVKLMDGARDYRMMTRQMVDSIVSLREYHRFSKGLFAWVGYNTKYLEYQNIERVAGKTTWSFWQLFKYSLEGITAFSTAPLTIASILGILLCFISFIIIVIIIIKTLIFGDPTSGWPSLACIVIFIGGIQLFSVGIIGEYLARTYMEVKKRPIYIAKEYIGINKKEK